MTGKFFHQNDQTNQMNIFCVITELDCISQNRQTYFRQFLANFVNRLI